MSSLVQRLRADERLLVLCGATFLVTCGQGVVSPVLPLYAKAFGVGTTMVGLTITMFAVARLLINVPAGMVADRFGRRALLIGGPIVTAIGMIGSGLADSIYPLLFWRFVAGAGSALYMGGAMVYLIDIARPEQLSRYVATNQWALSLGFALGPGLGGIVADRWGLDVPFYVVAGFLAGAAVYSIVRLPETLHLSVAKAEADAAEEAARGASAVEAGNGRTVAGSTGLPSVRALLLSVPFAALAFSSMTIFLTRGGTRGTLIPLRADEALGWGPREVGLMFTLTGGLTLVTLLPAAWASDRIGRRWVILFSGVMAGIGALVVAQTSTAAAFVLGNVVMSLGTGTAGPAPAAFVADITPARLRGVMVGFYRSAGDVGIIAGPVLLGLLADRASLPTAIGVGAAMVALGGIIFFLVTARHPAAGRQR